MSWFSRLRAAGRGLPGAERLRFTPLYSEDAHPGIIAAMHAIEIVPIKDRVGHYLGEDLIHEHQRHRRGFCRRSTASPSP